MNSPSLCIVVIPIHSPHPSRNELISFAQCFRILGKHPIQVIAPLGLNITAYQEVVSSFEIKFIDERWQSSLLNYNKLKLSKFFYRMFSSYEYLLTYELDAFVFSDELAYWCGKGYDYIGAPWFEGYTEPTNKILGVGNSGFSLRKIARIQEGLSTIFYKDPTKYKTGTRNLIKAFIKQPYAWLRNKTGENYTIQSAAFVFEDRVVCDLIGSTLHGFSVAPIEDAYRFSFEANPRFLFELNQCKLPMGCHAWWRYDYDFWKSHIESFGYVL